MARDNKVLGTFKLTGLPPAPRGVPQIEVSFDIDANGILNVSAKDTATGKEQSITITASSGLTGDEVDQMVKEAEKHKQEDLKRKEEIELRNQADQMLYSTEKLLTENTGKVSPEDEQKVRDALEELKKAKEGGSAESIKKAIDELNTATHSLAEAMYAQAKSQQEAAAPPEGGAAPNDGAEKKDEGEVIDAEYEDVKE